jgi:hypothetical protein
MISRLRRVISPNPLRLRASLLGAAILWGAVVATREII